MRVDVITIFPEIFSGWASHSLVRVARDKCLFDLQVHDLKDFSGREDGRVDDRPFGGGPGMVLRVEPVLKALESIEGWEDARKIHYSPSGVPWRQEQAMSWQKDVSHAILLCSRYEGVDQRALDLGGFEEVSLGDYVAMGGEAPAMVWMETVLRLQPGVLGDQTSSEYESFSTACAGGLDHPHYTRPAEFRGKSVPPILLSGDHSKVEGWRRQEALKRTEAVRPDLKENTSWS